MFKVFALIAVIHGNVYVVDTDLSADDCMIAVQDGVSLIQVDNDTFISAQHARLACEVMEVE